MEEFLDRATRQVNGELREVKKLVDRHLRGEAQDPVAFQEGLHDYYTGDFVGFARDLYLPSFRTYAGLVVPQAVEEAPEDVEGEEPTPEELNAFVDEYTDNAVAGIAAGGRQSLVERSNREEPLEEVEAELANWESDDNGTSSRAQRIARRHVNELNQATSTFVWAALAVAFLVALAVGESCPYCNAIDGTRVAMGTPFFNAGDSLQPDGQDAALSFKGTKRYPPWHQGCDCAVRPEV